MWLTSGGDWSWNGGDAADPATFLSVSPSSLRLRASPCGLSSYELIRACSHPGGPRMSDCLPGSSGPQRWVGQQRIGWIITWPWELHSVISNSPKTLFQFKKKESRAHTQRGSVSIIHCKKNSWYEISLLTSLGNKFCCSLSSQSLVSEAWPLGVISQGYD